MRKQLIDWIHDKLGMSYTQWKRQPRALRVAQYGKYQTGKTP
jgi:hypothetical protein